MISALPDEVTEATLDSIQMRYVSVQTGHPPLPTIGQEVDQQDLELANPVTRHR
jgi:hypothetical protein